MAETWTFTASLWRWNAKQESTDPGSWSFVTLPTDVAEDIRDVMVEPPRGFGSVKVQVVVGEERGIAPERVVAFGDARNDLPMLAWAGTGVAMADAHPSVIAAADDVTGTVYEDGAATEIARWFPAS